MLEFAASLTVLRATIAPGHPSTQGPVEQAVLDLLVEITDEARVEELLESA